VAIETEPITLEAFLQLPEEKPALEYSDGVITQKMSPKGEHSRLQTFLVERLNRAGESGRIALAFSELRSSFAGKSRVPDIAVYRWERIPITEGGRIASDFTSPPDIAIEIVSPGQSAGFLVRRCLWYVDNGVSLALLVDPFDESVFAFRPGSEALALRHADPIDLSQVLPSFQLTAGELFDSLTLGT
jgi:Uma2 family endonuclease